MLALALRIQGHVGVLMIVFDDSNNFVVSHSLG